MQIETWEQLKSWLTELGALEPQTESPEMVKRLDLSDKALEQLPEAIGMLEGLVALNLSNNLLAELPESISKLTSLTTLNIRRNRFTELPASIGTLPLRSLNANGNRIDDASVLKQCRDLRVLDLSVNMLASLQGAIDPENELRVVNLSCNYFEEIGYLFEDLSATERLDLSGNMIRNIPETIGNMEGLVVLSLANNHIESIDDAFFDLPVEEVDLSSNEITTIHLRNLEDLETITLDFNPIEEITVAEDFAPYLESFSCDGCGLESFLPLKSTELKNLCYSSNELKEIPEWVSQYSQLHELDLDGNQIVDLPDSMANLTNLKILYIEDNPLNEHAKRVIDILHPEICDIKMKRGVTVERAQEGDLSQMAELLSELFAIEQDFEIDFEKQLAGITKLFHHEGKELLVARHEGKVVGMVTMQRLISSAEGDYIGQIEDLIVREDYRKMGIGSRLLNKMRAIAQELKYKRIQLAADAANENAQEFYVRRGFYQTHLKVFHYKA
ncbi:MAG TPA: GNAT family N-acetyltransferase [Campylobacteraceae bacterium]|nr:GNAT family N-acetyltransferase [Campylobacteraceae bacterium]